jgi:hypothetical protein
MRMPRPSGHKHTNKQALTGRADQQAALGDARADCREALGALQELDNLLF